ncbi:hypothetical protein LCGC14_3018290 [marine sediment metagenome]|uniref:Uncharacterized protein n=1 Tax=marine sediment metagenome TaxID=412755 RepID=A0A0F8WW11_9ZZZZ
MKGGETKMETFGKYVGVQGIVFVALAAGYIVAPFADVVLPEGYTEILTLTFGFYFAKNGVAAINRVRG